ncbi:Chlorocatechol 1,2-dioxygenase [Streptomyces chartreusis NRRL 3882]|uniref:Chlorocatechol 1,2-dioxygenase n=1 Tax=Streptomyces chartreusis NRRL 3882 TaxID=1079985 RepID=A0A2N9BM45_STRCX|nr:Chlorocatechol 1,2-dioxygenase [Streptomyces chartreusis NRRL 3882]
MTLSSTDKPLLLRPADPDAPVEIDETKLNHRLIEIEEALVAAIAPVFREKKITHAEYELFRDVIRVLQRSNAVEGFLDVWLDRLTDETTADGWEGTPSNPEGPYYVPGAPLLKSIGPGACYVLPMRSDEPGVPLIVSGQVRAMDGKPLAMAELDTWQCADTGVYSMLGMDDQPDWNLRGRFHTDQEGRFEFRTIRPVPYMPADIQQIILDFYDALGKAHYRPRHIHLKVRHEDIAADGQFMTQLYFQGDPYLQADPGQNAHTRLAMPTVTNHEPAELKARGLQGHDFFHTAHFDLTIATATTVPRRAAQQAVPPTRS